ncbi:MAG: hypothetical protein HZB62_02980 [Nitrospirae bacterium]|nr:hypothetical protein [Nitrospirota bacterium]
MRRSQGLFCVVVMVLLVAFGIYGCAAKPAGPKDEDAVKVIQAFIESSPNGPSFKAPVVILEKGQKLPTGDYPVKVEYTLANPDGTTKKVTAKFNLTPSVNDMGANVWNASEAK